MGSGKAWCKEDDDYLKNNPDATISELTSKLNRSYKSITSRRSKLGLKSSRWSDGKVKLLCEIFPVRDKEYIIQAIGKKWSAIFYKARAIGLSRAKFGNRNKTTQDYINEAKSVHGDRYGYKRTEYKGTNEKVIVTCKQHGDFYVTAREHVRKGIGCGKCTSSYPERRIEKFLKDNGISFKREYRFSECKNEKAIAV